LTLFRIISLLGPVMAVDNCASSPGSSIHGNNERVEEILQSLIPLPLKNHYIVRAIQTALAHQPYSIAAILTSARVAAEDQTVLAGEKSLEARIFRSEEQPFLEAIRGHT
jgi:hypothetical protein